MDMLKQRKTGRIIRFTVNGKQAELFESVDLFDTPVVTLIIDGEYIGAYETFDIDEVHARINWNPEFIKEAYC